MMLKAFDRALTIAMLICCLGCSPKNDSFSITTKQADDVATIEVIRNRVVATIHSPKGISSATIERKGASWPDSIELRLYLKGLENLEVSSGKNVLEASYSNESHELIQSKDGNDKETLQSTSDYWMNFEIIDEFGKVTPDPSPPDGYFSIKLPKQFLAEAKQSIVIDWIDFHR